MKIHSNGMAVHNKQTQIIFEQRACDDHLIKEMQGKIIHGIISNFSKALRPWRIPMLQREILYLVQMETVRDHSGWYSFEFLVWKIRYSGTTASRFRYWEDHVDLHHKYDGAWNGRVRGLNTVIYQAQLVQCVCAASSIWVPFSNAGGQSAARKGTEPPTVEYRGSVWYRSSKVLCDVHFEYWTRVYF